MHISPVVRQVRLRPILKGCLTAIPGMQRLLPPTRHADVVSAEYCYGVWLKHLALAWDAGLRGIPRTLAEFGPGESLGVGLAAMLCGTSRYYALDVVERSTLASNLPILDELVTLFRSRAGRPTKGWPEFDDLLDTDLFPHHILGDALLAASLAEPRVAAIRRALAGEAVAAGAVVVKYMVPWSSKDVVEDGTVDFILSHSVLEHVEDLEGTYVALHSWLSPGGMMSHQIDLTSHGLSEKWNGYRAYPEWLWRLMAGTRPFLINRQPYSVHLDLLEAHGFTVVRNLKRYREDGIERSELSPHWRDISDLDLDCPGAFIQAVKHPSPGGRVSV